MANAGTSFTFPWRDLLLRNCLLLKSSVLLVLLLGELVGLTTWLDTASISGGGGLKGFISDYGPVLLRAAVVFAALFVTIARTQVAAVLSAGPVVNTRCILPHLVCFAAFIGASHLLFSGAATYEAALSMAWLVAGTACAVSALCIVAAPRHLLQLAWNSRVAAGVSAAIALGTAAFGEAAPRVAKGWSRVTFDAVGMVLRPLFPDMTIDWSQRLLQTPEFAVTVADSCSGIEGTGLVIAFCAVWLWCFRADYRFPQALVLAPAGVAAVWVLNVFRLAALFAIGATGAPAIAAGGFHSQAGWIAFTAVALGMMWTARRVPALAAGPRLNTLPQRENEAEWYLTPFMAVMATGMATIALSPAGIDWLYPLRVVAAAAVLFAFRRQYSRLDWRFGFRGVIAGVSVFLLWAALEQPSTAARVPMQQAVAQAEGSMAAGWLFFRVFGSTLTVPIAEELAFRGFLIGRLHHAGWSIALVTVGSSVAFGLLHGDRWIAGTIAGLIYAAAYLHKRRIGEAVAAHAITNGLIAWQVLFAGDWHFWA